MRCAAHAVISSISTNASGAVTPTVLPSRVHHAGRDGSHLAGGLSWQSRRGNGNSAKPMTAGGFFAESEMIPGTLSIGGGECGGDHAVTGGRTAMTTCGKGGMLVLDRSGLSSKTQTSGSG